MRQLRGATIDLTPEQEATRDALQAELDAIEAEHSGTDDDLPEEVDARLAEIEAALESLDHPGVVYDPGEIARAGAFISIDAGGGLRVERGYVRPEHEAPVAPEPERETVEDAASEYGSGSENGDEHRAASPIEPEEEDGIRPLSDRLMVELTSHRTVALRHVLGERPDIAFLAATHALSLQTFYLYPLDSCVEIKAGRRGLANVPGLADSPAAVAVGERHQALRDLLPSEPGELWDALIAMDRSTVKRILAHCVADSVNAVDDPYERRPRAVVHAGRLARAVDLDLAAEGWMPTVDNYLGRVTKARVLVAVEQGAGMQAAQRIAHLKKGEMAEQAEALLAGTGWLPEPLRTDIVGTGKAPTVTGDDVEPGTLPDETGSDTPGDAEPNTDVGIGTDLDGGDTVEAELDHALAAE